MSSRALISYRAIPGPATSNAVGVRADIIKSGITMSLAMLKEAGSLASKIPCISVIAGMLLYYIQVHDDIQLCKREWMVVAQKLVDVASLVISVGKSCEMLGEEDLVPLQADLQHLQRDLEGIGEALKECAGSSRVKKMFMRADILLKIKHCDGMLTHALSMFQTRTSLRIHYTQLTQGREVRRRDAMGESARMDSFDSPKAVVVKGVPPVDPKQQRETCGVCDKTFGSKRQRRRHACLRPSSPSSSDETDDWRVREEEEALNALALDSVRPEISRSKFENLAELAASLGTRGIMLFSSKFSCLLLLVLLSLVFTIMIV